MVLMDMNIEIVKVGFLETNCYILSKDNDYLVIDPGDEFEKIDSHIKGNLVGIIITHYHFDHIGALDDLVNKYHVNVYDINNLNEGLNKIGNFEFRVYYTPGHKSDLISILFDNYLFSGDFIFESSIGRTDLPTGNFKEMQDSIRKILKLDDNIIIYPGHGEETTMKKERNNLNSYL